MLLLTVFGTSSLLMAAIGIDGLMAYSVRQRTLERGVRMALGASASNIRNMVIRPGMLLAGIGLVIGIGGALWLTKFLAGFLFGVKMWDPTDPTAFVLTCGLSDRGRSEAAPESLAQGSESGKKAVR